jgi:hypothetical protein
MIYYNSRIFHFFLAKSDWNHCSVWMEKGNWNSRGVTDIALYHNCTMYSRTGKKNHPHPLTPSLWWNISPFPFRQQTRPLIIFRCCLAQITILKNGHLNAALKTTLNENYECLCIISSLFINKNKFDKGNGISDYSFHFLRTSKELIATTPIEKKKTIFTRLIVSRTVLYSRVYNFVHNSNVLYYI